MQGLFWNFGLHLWNSIKHLQGLIFHRYPLRGKCTSIKIQRVRAKKERERQCKFSGCRQSENCKNVQNIFTVHPLSHYPEVREKVATPDFGKPGHTCTYTYRRCKFKVLANFIHLSLWLTNWPIGVMGARSTWLQLASAKTSVDLSPETEKDVKKKKGGKEKKKKNVSISLFDVKKGYQLLTLPTLSSPIKVAKLVSLSFYTPAVHAEKRKRQHFD